MTTTLPTIVVDDRVHVLIVDDSEDQLLLLRTYFERSGCDVAVASTAEEALASHGYLNADLAVIDLVLPGMDGWTLASHMTVDKPDCVIAITSVLDTGDYPAGHISLPKPVTREHVRQVLRDSMPKWVEA